MVVSHFMSMVEENNYVQWTRHDPDGNEVINSIFARPDSVNLLRIFLYGDSSNPTQHCRIKE